MTKFTNSDVEKKFDNYPNDIRKKLLELREMIYDVAKHKKGVMKSQKL